MTPVSWWSCVHRRQKRLPPEDSGGTYSFAELKEVFAGPPSPERDERLEWMGDEDYDPADFDPAAANAAVAAV